MISIPSDSRKATNRWYRLSGLSRSATVVIGQPLAHDPRAGEVPVAGVRQRDHAAGAGRDRLAEQVFVAPAGSRRRICCRDSFGSRNASSQYRAYERSPSRTSSVAARPRAGPGRPPGAGCARSRCGARAALAGRAGPRRPGTRPTPPPRQRLDQRPAGGVPELDRGPTRSRLDLRVDSRRRLLAADVHQPLHHGDHRQHASSQSARPGPSARRSRCSRPPMPIRISRSIRSAMPDVAAEAEPLRPGLHVGDDLAADQADQRRPRRAPAGRWWPATTPARRRWRRRRPGPWSSRAARRTGWSSRGPGPSRRRARRAARTA